MPDGPTGQVVASSSYRRGYLAGRALARRGAQVKRATGRPRKPDSDPVEYERGFAAGLAARTRPVRSRSAAAGSARPSKPAKPRCTLGCEEVVRNPGPCGFCLEERALRPVPVARARRGRKPDWPQERIIELLQAWVIEHGRSPRYIDFDQTDVPVTARTIARRMGRWDDVLAACGLEPPPPIERGAKWPRERIIARIQELARELGRAPKFNESRPMSAAAQNEFGSWSAAVAAAGFTAPRRGPVPQACAVPVMLAEVHVSSLLREQPELITYARRALAETDRDERSPAMLVFGHARQPIVGDNGRALTHGEVDRLLASETENRSTQVAT